MNDEVISATNAWPETEEASVPQSYYYQDALQTSLLPVQYPPYFNQEAAASFVSSQLADMESEIEDDDQEQQLLLKLPFRSRQV